MPWTKKEFPASMKNLPKVVREKAIEIANTLLEERNINEGIAIATAISRAKDWAVNHGKNAKATKDSKTTDVKQHGEDRYVTPHGENSWAIKKEANNRIERVVDAKSEAVKQAKEEASRANASVTIQKRTGRIQKRISYNPNRRAKKQK